MVYGDGKLVGYNLDQPTESSSTMEFLKEKYPVVIGELCVQDDEKTHNTFFAILK